MITTVTLNASIDKAYVMERAIENGTVMRVKEVRNTAGGKGLNVAKVARICGADVQATGFAGGFNGQYLEDLARRSDVETRFFHVEGETRSCINILDPKYGSTEYLEPGFDVKAEDVDRFLKEFPKTGTLSLYSAVEKMTAIPANRLHLENKGRLNVGADADIAIFDYETISDNATFAQPALEPVGIEYVFVGGELALEKGTIRKADCGKAIRK
jgi:hypothetical protein